MSTEPSATAFEAQGCRALARLGGRMTMVYGVAAGLGLLVAAGSDGIATAVPVLLLAGLAAVATGYAGLLLPGGRGRHAVGRSAGVGRWLPRSRRLRQLAPVLLVGVVLVCGVLSLVLVRDLAPVLGWPRVHQFAGWVIPGFGIGLALAIGPLWGLASLAVLGCALQLLLEPGPQAAVPATVGAATVSVLVAAAVHLACRAGFRETERIARAAEEADDAHRDAEQRLLARRRSARTLHDTVLATLTLLAHAGVGVPPDQLRAACRRDLAVLQGARPEVAAGLTSAGSPGMQPTVPGQLAGRLGEVRRLAAGRGIDLRVHLQSGSAVEALADPGDHPRLLQAWSGALTECVANIARHADVAAADVVLGLTDDALVTVVVDEGVGFEPAGVDGGRMGLSGSVQDRLVEVGGRARVWSQPGQGTVVELLLPWPRRAAPTDEHPPADRSPGEPA